MSSCAAAGTARRRRRRDRSTIAGPPPRAASPLPHRDPRHVGAAPRRRAAASADRRGRLEASRAAALFHDVVYDPRSSTNEADSAAGLAAVDAARLELDPLRPGRPSSIEATATHEPAAATGHADAAVLLDADLAILGRPRRYQAYVNGVRSRVRRRRRPAWRTGRPAVLRHGPRPRCDLRDGDMRVARERGRGRTSQPSSLGWCCRVSGRSRSRCRSRHRGRTPGHGAASRRRSAPTLANTDSRRTASSWPRGTAAGSRPRSSGDGPRRSSRRCGSGTRRAASPTILRGRRG